MSEEYPEFDEDEPIDMSEVYPEEEFTSVSAEMVAEVDPSHGTGIPDLSDKTLEYKEQYVLLCYLCANRELWIRCSHILNEDYFVPAFRPVVKFVKKFEIENQVMPSDLVIMGNTNIRFEVPDDVEDPQVQDNIAEQTEHFCQFSAAEFVLESSYEELQHAKSKGQRSRGTISNFVNLMSAVSEIAVTQHLGYELHHDVEELLTKSQSADGIPTGMLLVDEALNGGVTMPSLNYVSAASGGGKSIYLQNQAVNDANAGNDVVYISLELKEFMIAKRFAGIITGIGLSSIYGMKDQAVTIIRQNQTKQGRIFIKRLPMNGTTMSDIRAYVNSLNTKIHKKLTHVYIDYADVMSPSDSTIPVDNIHLRDAAIATEMYDWISERGYEKIVWTASQQTKGSKEEKDARQGAVAGGTGKVNTADNLFIIKRNIEDIQEQRCWIHIEKGRNGGTGVKIPMHWDKDSQKMACGEDMRQLYEETNHRSAQSQSQPRQNFGKKPKVPDPIVAQARGGTASPSPSSNMSKIDATRQRILQRSQQRGR